MIDKSIYAQTESACVSLFITHVVTIHFFKKTNRLQPSRQSEHIVHAIRFIFPTCICCVGLLLCFKALGSFAIIALSLLKTNSSRSAEKNILQLLNVYCFSGIVDLSDRTVSALTFAPDTRS